MDALTRRSFFRLGLTVSAVAAGGAALTACSGGKPQPASAAGGCANPEDMSPSETSLRDANHYVENSADAAKTCAACTFFTPGADGAGCGTCQIYTGGPANAKGYCDSWAAKAAA
jgi:hypothetical protein